MKQFIKKIQEIMSKMTPKNITDSGDNAQISETREIGTMSGRDTGKGTEGTFSEKTSALGRRDMKTTKNQKVPNNRDSLKWTRGGLHPFHQVLTLICYFIHHGPGSTFSLYTIVAETSKQKEPLLKEALFVAPDEVRNVRTISVNISIAKSI